MKITFELEKPDFHWLLMLLGAASADERMRTEFPEGLDHTLRLVNTLIGQSEGRSRQIEPSELKSEFVGIVADPQDAAAAVSHLLSREKMPVSAILLWYPFAKGRPN